MTFSEKLLAFHRGLQPNWKLPKGVDLLFPYDNSETWAAMSSFFQKYFNDKNQRTLLLGINPGRFGAGVTGTPFTDPIRLAEVCGIDNPFKKRQELSSVFVYEFIHAFGTVEAFYQQFYITSVCPMGFVKNGVNYNYYDDKGLQKAVEPYILHNLQQHLNMGCNPDRVLILGQGKNYKYLKKLNEQHEFFGEVVPLPHPRWVMQYRRKKMNEFVAQYVRALKNED